jgi:pyruvate dehydrogenase E1 component alpha subunit
MAALWKLPVVYVIENNKYGMGTSVQRAAAGKSLAERGHPYGIPGQQVDGMDVIAVKEAGSDAVKHARDGEGPFILEMMTYRYRGHSMSDPAKYRSKEEVEKMRTEHDPISRVRDLLQAAGTSEDELKKLDREIRDLVADAADFAQTSPEPPEAELWTDVLADA